MPTLEEIRLVYGNDAVITRKGAFTLVHLDRPSRSVMRERTRAFDPDDFFFDDCPLCQMVKAGGVIVYDDPAVREDD
ncbi:MAG TPA: hypothetical protein VFY29_07255 [Terriglobia bacterium]|nr:hypothetical protein [Terriglobia bacterium]